MFDAKIVANQVIEWTAEYFRNNGSSETKAVVGISGGKDSSVTAAICAKALCEDRVLGVLMPQGIQSDIDVALDLCETLGIPYIVINIENTVQALYDQVIKTGLKLNDIATFNTPARIRMTTLYAVSGIVGGRVANTSNLDEIWIGYETKFGDSAGDFSPLANLTVNEVKAVGKELGLASKFIYKTPIDGLCGQADEERLGFTYDVSGRYIREGVCDDQIVKEKIDNLHALSRHKVNPMPMFKLRK